MDILEEHRPFIHKRVPLRSHVCCGPYKIVLSAPSSVTHFDSLFFISAHHFSITHQEANEKKFIQKISHFSFEINLLDEILCFTIHLKSVCIFWSVCFCYHMSYNRLHSSDHFALTCINLLSIKAG